jgi:outer membrane cobalamin receptor
MRFTPIFRSAAASFAVAAVLASAAPAMAQDAADENEGLGDIIVTAQRRAENQKDVPCAVMRWRRSADRAPISGRCRAGSPA